MAESKLGIYQLAYPQQSGLGNGKQNWFQRNNINVKSVAEGLMTLVNVAGGVANVINQFKTGGRVTVNGEQLSQVESKHVYEAAVAQQQGGAPAVERYAERQGNSQIIELLMMKMMADDKPKNNTGLYIGLGVGGLLLVGLIAVIAMKK